jgi:SAM-dependent methyltransferase
MAGVPERIRWAVEALGVERGSRLFEIGCGGGVAVALVCETLAAGAGGRITAVDRSPVATARALARNADAVADGRAVVATAAFAAGDLAAAGLPTSGRPYDAIFSINVNLWWTGPARAELALARALLRPGGRLLACYEPPGDRQPGIAQRVSATLSAGGFTPAVAGGAGQGGFAVIGTWPESASRR